MLQDRARPYMCTGRQPARGGTSPEANRAARAPLRHHREREVIIADRPRPRTGHGAGRGYWGRVRIRFSWRPLYLLVSALPVCFAGLLCRSALSGCLACRPAGLPRRSCLPVCFAGLPVCLATCLPACLARLPGRSCLATGLAFIWFLTDPSPAQAAAWQIGPVPAEFRRQTARGPTKGGGIGLSCPLSSTFAVVPVYLGPAPPRFSVTGHGAHFPARWAWHNVE